MSSPDSIQSTSINHDGETLPLKGIDISDDAKIRDDIKKVAENVDGKAKAAIVFDEVDKIFSKVVIPTVADDYKDGERSSVTPTGEENLNDPGNDLDKLLTKINEVVSECIDDDASNGDCAKKNSEHVQEATVLANAKEEENSPEEDTTTNEEEDINGSKEEEDNDEKTASKDPNDTSSGSVVADEKDQDTEKSDVTAEKSDESAMGDGTSTSTDCKTPEESNSNETDDKSFELIDSPENLCDFDDEKPSDVVALVPSSITDEPQDDSNAKKNIAMAAAEAENEQKEEVAHKSGDEMESESVEMGCDKPRDITESAVAVAEAVVDAKEVGDVPKSGDIEMAGEGDTTLPSTTTEEENNEKRKSSDAITAGEVSEVSKVKSVEGLDKPSSEDQTSDIEMADEEADALVLEVKKPGSPISTVTLDDDDEVEAKVEEDAPSVAATTEVSSDGSERKKQATDERKQEDDDDDVVLLNDDTLSATQQETPGENGEKQEAADEAAEPTETASSGGGETPNDEDDVVILDDDEPSGVEATDKNVKPADGGSKQCSAESQQTDEAVQLMNGEKQTDPETVSIADSTAKLISDSSDNACNDFTHASECGEMAVGEPLEPAADADKPKSVDLDEGASNCSSSSNLLQESKINGGKDERCSVGHDDDDESEYNENSDEVADKEGPPPAKRLRLSGDQFDSNAVLEEEEEVEEERKNAQSPMKTDENNTGKPDRKRSCEPKDDDVESSVKKPKVDDEAVDLCTPTEPDVEIVATTKPTETVTERTLKFLPSVIEVPLYPAPQGLDSDAVKTPTITLRAQFLERFQKSMDDMTKEDLENLVLTKLVEAITFKSQFADMQATIESQERKIAVHRAKIADLQKQVRDMEIVHGRISRELQSRNAHMISPLKIVRSVGMQVHIPNKRAFDAMQAASISSGSPLSPASVQSTPPRLSADVGSAGPSTGRARAKEGPAAAAGQRTATTASPGAAAQQAVVPAPSGGGAPIVRRKITPQRPDLPMHMMRNMPAKVTAVIQPQPPSSRAPGKSVANHPIAMPRTAAYQPRAVMPLQQQQNMAIRQPVPMQVQQQQQQQQQLSVSRRAKPTTVVLERNGQQQLMHQQTIQQPQPQHQQQNILQIRRSDGQPLANTTIPVINAALPGTAISQVSLMPARPKEKAVIDLTNEDDAVPNVSSTTGNGGRPVCPVAVLNPRHQPVTTSQTAAAIGRGPISNNVSGVAYLPPRQNGPTVGRLANGSAPPVGKALTTIRPIQPSQPIQARAALTSQSTNFGRATITAAPRPRLVHPAPLPRTPPQISNPAWKAPPPRPAIRISNLENGIVISWTMEDTSDRYAECTTYQIFAYQETSHPPATDNWRLVGDVKAMLLPMAVTLTQFQEGQRYYFAVRAIDVHTRYGPFSAPNTW